jgi:hypothetical protein
VSRLAVFLLGFGIGALVGAAIAGSRIWRRARSRTIEEPVSPVPPRS